MHRGDHRSLQPSHGERLRVAPQAQVAVPSLSGIAEDSPALCVEERELPCRVRLRIWRGVEHPGLEHVALVLVVGEERLASDAKNVLVTRRKDGTLVIATWNAVDPDKKGAPQTLTLRFKNVGSKAPVTIHRVDPTHGNVLTTYEAMGKPRYPTQKQISEMNRASALPGSHACGLT